MCAESRGNDIIVKQCNCSSNNHKRSCRLARSVIEAIFYRIADSSSNEFDCADVQDDLVFHCYSRKCLCDRNRKIVSEYYYVGTNLLRKVRNLQNLREQLVLETSWAETRESSVRTNMNQLVDEHESSGRRTLLCDVHMFDISQFLFPSILFGSIDAQR